MTPTSTLLVDDSASFLQSAMRFLATDERVDVVGLASSGSQALDRVAELNPQLVLMDLAMPGINGLEATRRLKAQPNPPWVVILTLHDTQEYRMAAAEAQADAFLTKSDFGDKLLPLIEQFRSGQRLRPIEISAGEEALHLREREKEELAARLRHALFTFSHSINDVLPIHRPVPQE
jgi:DNA-binding NarL/FixJ family response regulator